MTSPRKVFFVSLGCPKNTVDTEVMLGLTGDAGYEVVSEPDDAQVIVVNTCGFIGEAKEESVDTILEMSKYKEKNCERLVVTGCLSQRFPKELAKEMPEVDQFLGSGDVDKIVPALGGIGDRVWVTQDPAYLYDDVTPRQMSRPAFSAYVKIAEGCDRPCSFCIIPVLRGGQRSRTIDSVEREARDLVSRGAFELNLVAQDLTTYGKDLDKPVELAQLVSRLNDIDGLGWLRLHYAYPTATTDELLDVVTNGKRVAKYIDVPLQHIDDDVLKIMRRGYGAKVCRNLIERVRSRMPDCTLRTTFIVGHPGETEDSFKRLLDFVEESEFDHVGVFTYSKEDGTHAATLDGDVAHRTAERRRRDLMRLQRKISRKKMKARVGTELDVLVEGPSEESEFLYAGRHEGQAPGQIDGGVFLSLAPDLPALRPGDVVRAKVTGFAEYDLAATALKVMVPSRLKRQLKVVAG